MLRNSLSRWTAVAAMAAVFLGLAAGAGAQTYSLPFAPDANFVANWNDSNFWTGGPNPYPALPGDVAQLLQGESDPNYAQTQAISLNGLIVTLGQLQLAGDQSSYAIAPGGGSFVFDANVGDLQQSDPNAWAIISQLAPGGANNSIAAPITMNTSLLINSSAGALAFTGGISANASDSNFVVRVYGDTAGNAGAVSFGTTSTYTGGTILGDPGIDLLAPDPVDPNFTIVVPVPILNARVSVSATDALGTGRTTIYGNSTLDVNAAAAFTAPVVIDHYGASAASITTFNANAALGAATYNLYSGVVHLNDANVLQYGTLNVLDPFDPNYPAVPAVWANATQAMGGATFDLSRGSLEANQNEALAGAALLRFNFGSTLNLRDQYTQTGAVVILNGGNAVSFSTANLDYGMDLNVTGISTLNLNTPANVTNNAVTEINNLSISDGTLTIQMPQRNETDTRELFVVNGEISVAGEAVINLGSQYQGQIFSSKITGSGRLTLRDVGSGGIFWMTGASDYTGGTQIETTTFITEPNSLGYGAITLTPGAPLYSVATTNEQADHSQNDVIVSGFGTNSIAGGQGWSATNALVDDPNRIDHRFGTLTYTGSSQTFWAGGAGYNDRIVFSGLSLPDVDFYNIRSYRNTIVFDGPVVGDGTLVVLGTDGSQGIWLMGSSPTWTGGAQINSGARLFITEGDALGPGTSVLAGGTLVSIANTNEQADHSESNLIVTANSTIDIGQIWENTQIRNDPNMFTHKFGELTYGSDNVTVNISTYTALGQDKDIVEFTGPVTVNGTSRIGVYQNRAGSFTAMEALLHFSGGFQGDGSFYSSTSSRSTPTLYSGDATAMTGDFRVDKGTHYFQGPTSAGDSNIYVTWGAGSQYGNQTRLASVANDDANATHPNDVYFDPGTGLPTGSGGSVIADLLGVQKAIDLTSVDGNLRRMYDVSAVEVTHTWGNVTLGVHNGENFTLSTGTQYGLTFSNDNIRIDGNLYAMAVLLSLSTNQDLIIEGAILEANVVRKIGGGSSTLTLNGGGSTNVGFEAWYGTTEVNAAGATGTGDVLVGRGTLGGSAGVLNVNVSNAFPAVNVTSRFGGGVPTINLNAADALGAATLNVNYGATNANAASALDSGIIKVGSSETVTVMADPNFTADSNTWTLNFYTGTLNLTVANSVNNTAQPITNDGLVRVYTGASGTMGNLVSGPDLPPNFYGDANLASVSRPYVRTLQLDDGSSLSVAKVVQNAVTVGSGATLTLRGGSKTTSVVNTLAIAGATDAWTGQVDIMHNALIVSAGNLGTITNQIKTGLYNGPNGYWDGQGISSSTAANDSTFLTAVGVLDNSLAGFTDWEGVSGLTGTEVLVKYTYFGDADLSGVVDLDDFTLWFGGYLNSQTDWVNGDFDYDGDADLDDFTLWFGSYLNGGPPLAPASGAIPEPATLVLLAFGAVSLLKRRSRNQ